MEIRTAGKKGCFFKTNQALLALVDELGIDKTAVCRAALVAEVVRLKGTLALEEMAEREAKDKKKKDEDRIFVVPVVGRVGTFQGFSFTHDGLDEEDYDYTRTPRRGSKGSGR